MRMRRMKMRRMRRSTFIVKMRRMRRSTFIMLAAVFFRAESSSLLPSVMLMRLARL